MANLDTRVLIETVELEDTEHVLDIHQKDQFENLAVIGINPTNYPKNKYELSAYPGPLIVSDQARVEHKPYHLHVKSPNMGEIKIDIETLEIMGTENERKRTIPKDLMKHLKKNKAHYRKAIEQVYNTGKFTRTIK